MGQSNRKRINELRGTYELRCECGKPGRWLLWLDQLDGDGDTLQSATRSAVRQWMAANPPAEVAQIATAMHRTYKAVWGVVRRMSLSGELVAVDTRTTSNGGVVNIWGLK